MKTSGVGVFDERLEAVVPEAMAPHAPAICCDVDAPGTLDRMERDPSDAFRAQVSRALDPSSRVFEAAGAGACLIADTWVGIDDCLEPAREVLVAESGAYVAAHMAARDAVLGNRAAA